MFGWPGSLKRFRIKCKTTSENNKNNEWIQNILNMYVFEKKNLYLNWGFWANVFRKLRQPPAEEPRIQAPFSTLPSQPCSPPPLALSGPKWQISSLWKYVVKSSKDILHRREKVTKKNTRLGFETRAPSSRTYPCFCSKKW